MTPRSLARPPAPAASSTRRPVAAAAAAGLLLALAAASAAAQSAMPPPPAANPASAQQPGRFAFLRYGAPVPRAWVPQPPSSGFRAAQYRVPAVRGASDAEVVVFHFGAGQGGSAAANIERWSSQFSSPDGQPVKPKVETLRVDGMPATLVELTGRYARGVGMAPGVAPRPGQTLLAAVVEAPEGNLTFQLHGDTATVVHHRGGFIAMVKGLHKR